MDALMLSLCSVSNRRLLCGSLSNDKTKLDILVRGQLNLPNSSLWWMRNHIGMDGWCVVVHLLL